MITAQAPTFRLGEVHSFQGGGQRYLYLVQSAGIFQLDDATARVIDLLAEGEISGDRLLAELSAAGLSRSDAGEVLEELWSARAILTGDARPQDGVQNPPPDFPLQTLVMNLTNQCNLSCQYCYEFGEDKVATPEGKPKFMDLETAKASVDFLLQQSARAQRGSHHVLRRRDADEFSAAEAGGRLCHANRRRAGTGRSISASRPTPRC